MAENEIRASDELDNAIVRFKKEFRVKTLTLWKDGDEWVKEMTFDPKFIPGGVFKQSQWLHPDMSAVVLYLESIFRRLSKEKVTKVKLLYDHDEKPGFFGLRRREYYFFMRYSFGDDEWNGKRVMY